jgi:hypothetical protein
MPTPHNILLLAFPNGQLLDITGPLQMFAGANDELSRRVYRIEVAAPQAGPFATSSGVRLVADMPFARVTNVTDAAGRRYDIPVAVGHRYSVGSAEVRAQPELATAEPTVIWTPGQQSGAVGTAAVPGVRSATTTARDRHGKRRRWSRRPRSSKGQLWTAASASV